MELACETKDQPIGRILMGRSCKAAWSWPTKRKPRWIWRSCGTRRAAGWQRQRTNVPRDVSTAKDPFVCGHTY